MKKLAGFLGAVGMLAVAPLAHADFTISYQVGALGAIVQCADSPSNTLATCSPNPIVAPPVTIKTLSGSSNSPGGVPFPNANQSGSTVDVVATAATTVTFWFSAQDFSFPTAPPGSINWTANLQFTSQVGTGTLNLENCVDQANGNTPSTLPGRTIPGFCTSPAGILNNDPLLWSGITTPPSDTVHSSISTLSPLYALQQMLTVVFTTPGEINFVTSQVLTPVPEPMSIALLGAVFLLTSRSILRKRKQAS